MFNANAGVKGRVHHEFKPVFFVYIGKYNANIMLNCADILDDHCLLLYFFQKEISFKRIDI